MGKTYTFLMCKLLDDTILWRANNRLHLHGLDTMKPQVSNAKPLLLCMCMGPNSHYQWRTLLHSLPFSHLITQDLARHRCGYARSHVFEAQRLVEPRGRLQ